MGSTGRAGTPPGGVLSQGTRPVKPHEQSAGATSSLLRYQGDDGHTASRERDLEPATLIHNPTINQQIRNRRIIRDQHGVPVGKLYK